MRSAYNFWFDVAAFLVYACILFFGYRSLKGKRLQNAIFFCMTVDGMLSSLFDIGTAFSDVLHPTGFFLKTRGLFNYWYLLIHNLQPFLFLLYVLAVADIINIYRKKLIYFMVAPYLISFLFLVTNPWTHFIFYFDDSDVKTALSATEMIGYKHGNGIYIIYFNALLYLLLVLVLIGKFTKIMELKDKVSIVILGIGAFLSIAIQLILGDVMIEVFIQSLLFLGLFSALEERSLSYDKNTGCYGRRMFMEQLSARFKHHFYIKVLTIRIDGLKYFRTFRSQQDVDEVYRILSSWLKKTTKEERIYDMENNTITVIVSKGYKEETFYQALQKECNVWPFLQHIRLHYIFFNYPYDADNLEDALTLMEHKYETDGLQVKGESLSAKKREIFISHILKDGLERNQFYIALQPIVGTDESIASAEVLIRFTGTDEKLYPADFIPIAEKTGIIWDIGLFTIEEAAKILSSEEGKKLHYLEVNLSTVQCMHGGCVEAFLSILEKYDVTPDRINLEITESAFIDDFDAFYTECQRLRKAGFRFSVDDYGSGFSNYRYIVAVEPDIVKLDRDILVESETKREGKVFYENAVQTIKDMGYQIVAEGVETEEQKAFVRSLGIDYIQGYYYSRPLKGCDFLKYLNGYHPVGG